MNVIAITANSVSLLFLLIILLGTLSSPQNKDISTKLFIASIALNSLGLVIDIISYLQDVYVLPTAIKYSILYVAYVMSIGVLVVFALYVVSLIRKRKKISYQVVFPTFFVSGLMMVMLAIGTIAGKAFHIVDQTRVVIDSKWESWIYTLSSLCIAYLFVLLIRYRKALAARELVALCSYATFPLITMGVHLVIPEQNFSYVQSAMSCLINYVLIQSRTIAEAELRERFLKEAFYIDSLTGLRNRYAYDKALNETPQKGPLGVVFADVNRLKQTNDTRGHEAGDQLLIRFAGLLRKHFPTGELFRISGDEFVVILTDVSEEQMREYVDRFRARVHREDWIAAFGWTYRECDSALELVREAERLMYEDKTLYYQSTGRGR